jgi:hypothetical protein
MRIHKKKKKKKKRKKKKETILLKILETKQNRKEKPM